MFKQIIRFTPAKIALPLLALSTLIHGAEFNDELSASLYTESAYTNGIIRPLICFMPGANVSAEFADMVKLSASASYSITDWGNPRQFGIGASGMSAGASVKTSVGDFGAKAGYMYQNVGWTIVGAWDNTSPLSALMYADIMGAGTQLPKAAFAEWSNKNIGTRATIGYAEMDGTPGFGFDLKSRPTLTVSGEQKIGTQYKAKAFVAAENDSSLNVSGNLYATATYNPCEFMVNVIGINPKGVDGLAASAKFYVPLKDDKKLTLQITDVEKFKGFGGTWVNATLPFGGQIGAGLVRNDPRPSNEDMRPTEEDPKDKVYATFSIGYQRAFSTKALSR
jgi:hypothetical protein